MRLNERYDFLPRWPVIEQSEDGREITVHARHVSLERWRLVKWLFRIAGLWGLYAACKYTYEHDPKALVIVPILVVVAYTIVANGLPTVRLLTWLLFRRRTVVRFTAQEITVNGRAYALSPDIEIQFRAHRPALPPQRARYSERTIANRYQQEFRIVEMIYGLRVVPITSIADDVRAEQFAIALQAAPRLLAARDTARKDAAALPE